MIFLIQTINNQIKHDFSLTLLESIRFYREFKRINLDYYLSNFIPEGNCENIIPVGSVEFVNTFFKEKLNIELKPINVPKILFPYAERRIVNLNKESYDKIPYIFPHHKKLFIKSNDKVKHLMTLDWFRLTDLNLINTENAQISEFIENIDSEYRCFVYKDKLIDIRRYSGDFTLFPNIRIIEAMIEVYKPNSPSTYTLDIGVNKNGGVFVIEVHDFYSCGLYGFNDLQNYPYMIIDWFLKANTIQ